MVKLTFDQAVEALEFEDSYSRLGVVMALRYQMGRDWWRVLGAEWSSCDNISNYRIELSRELRLASRDELDLIMLPDELSALRAMPAMLTVYRGCYAHNKKGLSWSLNRAVAERFLTLNRYRRAGLHGMLLTGRVRAAACALKLDRQEDEIISAKVRITAVEALPVTAEACNWP